MKEIKKSFIDLDGHENHSEENAFDFEYKVDTLNSSERNVFFIYHPEVKNKIIFTHMIDNRAMIPQIRDHQVSRLNFYSSMYKPTMMKEKRQNMSF